ncbi:MAG: DUF1211 domain-containing protein [Rhodobacteraceae bacterium]|nr:DUF1211 domain-containing protein [Paracoccaceae bacterium]
MSSAMPYWTGARMASETHQAPSTARIEAFSDGVIAIIITIMVIDLRPPVDAIDAGLVTGVLGPMAPKLASYALSFVIVAVMWVNHHELLRLAPGASRRLMWWNVNLLFWMSLIPMTTAILGERVFLPAAQILYAAVGFACATSFTLLRIHILRQSGSLGNRAAYLSIARSLVGPLFYLAAIAGTFAGPYVALVMFCSVMVYFLFPLFR